MCRRAGCDRRVPTGMTPILLAQLGIDYAMRAAPSNPPDPEHSRPSSSTQRSSRARRPCRRATPGPGLSSSATMCTWAAAARGRAARRRIRRPCPGVRESRRACFASRADSNQHFQTDAFHAGDDTRGPMRSGASRSSRPHCNQPTRRPPSRLSPRSRALLCWSLFWRFGTCGGRSKRSSAA